MFFWHHKHNSTRMNRFLYISLLLFLSSSTVSGFTIYHEKKTTSTTTARSMGQRPISWKEYKHDYVDPLVKHEAPPKVKDHTDPVKRAKADQFWLKQFEEDKEKLHRMMEHDDDNSISGSAVTTGPNETYEHYKHEYLDPITPHERASKVGSHMDPNKRKTADKYWLEWYKDEKQKLHEQDA